MIKQLWNAINGKKTKGGTIIAVLGLALSYLGHEDLIPDIESLYQVLVVSGVGTQIFGVAHKIYKALVGGK